MAWGRAFQNVSRALFAEGNDGPAMRQLAALEGAGSWTYGPVLDEALAELSIRRISKRLAALRLAHDLAEGMLAEPELSVSVWPSTLSRLWVSSGYIDDLAFVDNFDPHWSAYFDTEDAARTAFKLSLEQIAALDLSGGEAALPQSSPDDDPRIGAEPIHLTGRLLKAKLKLISQQGIPLRLSIAESR